jgi:hypothetical protein
MAITIRTEQINPPTTSTTGPLSVIDIASMAQGHDNDQQHVVGNRVDDAVVPHTNAIARPPPKGTRRRGPRVLGQEGDRSLNPRTNIGIQLAQ